MNDMNLSATPLIDIDHRIVGAPALAREIGERFQNGLEQEVIDFISRCDVNVLHHLSYLDPEAAIWQRDAGVWLTLARLTCQRGVLWREPPEELRQRDAGFSRELRQLGENWIAAAVKERREPDGAYLFVLSEIMYRLPYPGIPRDEVLGLVDWNLQLRRAKGIPDHSDYNCGLPSLIECLSDTADLIAISGKAERLCYEAIDVYKKRTGKGAARKRWLPWHDFFQQYPGHFDRYQYQVCDPALILRRWPDATPALRHAMATTLISDIPTRAGDDQAYFFDAVDQLVLRDEAAFMTLLDERSYLFDAPLASLIWEKKYPGLLPRLLPMIVEIRSSMDRYAKILCAMLSSEPDLVLTVAPGSLDRVIPLLSKELLRALLPVLGTAITNSSSKSLREAMVKASKKLGLADIAGAGWLAMRNKNLRLVCKDILLGHPDKAAATPLLSAMLAAGALDAASASAVAAYLDKLAPVIRAAAVPDATQATQAPAIAAGAVATGADRAAGVADTAAAPTDGELAGLEAQTAGIKRWSAAIKLLDNPESLALLRPLSEHAARATLHLAATGDDGLPPLASALLAQLPAENRARLAQHVVETWIGSEGEPKLRWMLRLAGTGADDRIVDLLAAAAFAWGKTKKQRAVVAVEHLAAIDSLYALARVLEISESRKVKDMVIDAAFGALRVAARRRKLAIGELLDELTPDFGLGNGIALTVGANSYRIELQGDLSLRLVDAKGKVSKTLPANKDDATRNAWDSASNQFKTISAGLKAIAKLQAPRMHAALVSGKSWSAQRWTQLFLDHAVLKIMARSLIWQTHGANPVSFRIAEDLSLLRADDEVFPLPAKAQVSLWHPATAKAGDVEAWRSNFADYELKPLVDQIGAPAALPPASAMTGDLLLAPAGLAVAQEQLASILSKCGYRQGPVGDGPSIDWHELPLAAAQLEVRLQNGYFSPYMNLGSAVEVESIQVWKTDGDHKLLAPADWPTPLLATLWSHLQLMEAKRIA